jgi:PAS domain S-box-containing protein
MGSLILPDKNVFEAVLDALPDRLYLLDEHLRIEWSNTSGRATGSEVEGEPCYRRILASQDPCSDCATRRALESGRPEVVELSVADETGETRYYLVTAVPLAGHGGTHGDGVLVAEVVRDITGRRHAEEEVRRVSDFNAAIIENAPVAIFTIDKSGTFLSVNPALEELSGLGARAAEKLLRFNWIENPFTVRSGLAEYMKRGLEGEPFVLWDFPFKTYRGDKSQYIHFRGVPLRRKDRSVEGLLCIIEDSTERVKAQAQLMQEAKMSAVGLLATATAHELNNPLATLVAHSELACEAMEGRVDGLVEADLEEVRGYMEVVQRQAFRCKKIVHDLFGLLFREQSEDGQTNVNEILDSIVATKEELRQRGIRVTRLFGANHEVKKGDASSLRQVFGNLIQNAIDASHGQTGAEIWIRTRLDNDGLTVEVEDNGVGIPDAIATHIFEPFFTTKKSSKGMGMGLKICDELLRKMGGHISMEQRQTGGTLFRVRFPAMRGDR